MSIFRFDFLVWKKCIQFLHDWSHFSSLKPLLPIYQSKLDRQQLQVPCKRKKWLFCCGRAMGRVLQTYIFPKRQVLNLTATITWNWRKSHFATLNYKQKKHRMLSMFVYFHTYFLCITRFFWFHPTQKGILRKVKI